MSNPIFTPSLIADAEIEKYRPLAGAAQRVGVLADVMRLLNFMDAFCLTQIDLDEKQSYDDNDYYTSTEVAAIYFDYDLIEERGGFDYLFAMYKLFHDEVSDDEFANLDELTEYLSDFEYRCVFLRGYVDFEELSRVMAYTMHITQDELRALMDYTMNKDVKTITDAFNQAA